jgi:protein-tyrosine phosphatase
MSEVEDTTTDRLVPAAGFRNLRDLGGLPVSGGGVTRSGLVYRSEAPTGLDEAQLEALGELGLRTAIDLRDEGSEDVFVVSTLPVGVARLVAGVVPPADPSGKGLLQQVMDGELLDYAASELAEMYIVFLETMAPAFGRAVSYVATPEHLPTLIHCHAGKDRTGLVVAMVLEVIGVPRDLVVEDYALTTKCRAYRRTEVEELLSGHGTEWDRVAPLFTAPPETLEISLRFLEEEHGSIRNYLLGPAEVSAEALDRLSELLVEQPA